MSKQSVNRSRICGSVTVFMSLSLLIVASLIFTLLESARVHGYKAYTGMTADAAVESLFSEYSDWIYKNYEIFVLDASFGEENISLSGLEGELLKYSIRNLDPSDRTFFRDGVNFYKMQVENAGVSQFLLASDYDGEAFVRMLCDQNRWLLTIEAAENIYEKLSDQTETVEETGDMESIIDNNNMEISSLIDEKNREEEDSYDRDVYDEGYSYDGAIYDDDDSYGGSIYDEIYSYGGDIYDEGEYGEYSDTPEFMVDLSDSGEETETEFEEDEEYEQVDNPVDAVRDIMTMDALSLVLPTGRALSMRHLECDETLERRMRNVGNMEDVYEDNPLNVVWFNKYMRTHLNCFSDGGISGNVETEAGADTQGSKTDNITHALDYELEYVMAGNDTDRDNLAAVVGELLLVREAANFAYLNIDSFKRNEALTLATAILAPTGVGEVAVFLLQEALLAAWAFIESVLDVRALLAGRRISWMKDESTWTSDLDSMAAAVSGNLMSIDCETGEDYRGYIEKLLFMRNLNMCGLRVMQVIESNYALNTGKESFRMDNCIIAAEADFEYVGKQLFLSFVDLLHVNKQYGNFKEKSTYRY